MNFKNHVERDVLAELRARISGKMRLILGFALAAGLALSQVNCSSRSSSIPAPPTPPTPPTPPISPTPSPPTTETAPTPTSETAAPVNETESPRTNPEAEGKESGSRAPSEHTSVAGAPEGRESSEAPRGSAEPAGTTPEGESTPGVVGGGAKTTEERTADLDRKLDSSLTEFDGILMKEQELLDERRESTGGGTMSGYGATGEEVSGGQGSGSEVSGGQQTGSEDTEYSARGGATGGSPDTPQGEPSESAPGESVGEDQAQTDNGRVPPDVGDGSDDDIVARQLREAAEKEDDPELREKLWDEYRAYKKGMKKD